MTWAAPSVFSSSLLAPPSLPLPQGLCTSCLLFSFSSSHIFCPALTQISTPGGEGLATFADTSEEPQWDWHLLWGELCPPKDMLKS